MAPLPEIEDTYRVAFNWDAYGVTNVMHFHAASATPAEVANTINASVNANMWNCMASFRVCTSIDVTPLDSMGSTYHYTTDGSSKWKGTIGTTEEIPATCAVVSLKTVFRGRSNRGRVYVGPLTEGSQASGMVGPAQITAMTTGWTTFQTTLITHDTQQVVASYKERTAITVVQYSIRAAAGVQRRRQSRLAA